MRVCPATVNVPGNAIEPKTTATLDGVSVTPLTVFSLVVVLIWTLIPPVSVKLGVPPKVMVPASAAAMPDGPTMSSPNATSATATPPASETRSGFPAGAAVVPKANRMPWLPSVSMAKVPESSCPATVRVRSPMSRA